MPARMATQDTREGYSSAVSHNNDNGIRLEVPTSHRPLLSDRRTPSVSSVSDDSQQDGDSLPSTGLRPARSFNVNRGWAHFDVKRGIYLKTPFLMISLFFLGLFAAVGHHAFYTSLDHGQVGSQSQQEWNLRWVLPAVNQTKHTLMFDNPQLWIGLCICYADISRCFRRNCLYTMAVANTIYKSFDRGMS